MPDQLTQLQLQLKNELENSILVEPEDRDFWLAQIPQLDSGTIQRLLETLTPANQLVNTYVDTALAEDKNQEHLLALKAKFDQIKKTALKLEEKTTSKSEQSQTEELLKQLDQIN
jgi:hypothetical protein